MKAKILAVLWIALLFLGCDEQSSNRRYWHRPNRKPEARQPVDFPHEPGEKQPINEVQITKDSFDASNVEKSEDAGAPDSSNNEAAKDSGQPLDSPNIFRHPIYGILVIADSGTTVTPIGRLTWPREPLAAASFNRSNGSWYDLLVYTKEPRQSISEWMAESEVGDSYLSTLTTTTASGQASYIYETNDHGAEASVHITTATDEFAYYFYSEQREPTIPDDFIEFVRMLRLQ